MLDYKVKSTDIKTEQDLDSMVSAYNTMAPNLSAFDTETTGTHIICDVPFLFQFGWIDNAHSTIHTYTVDIELLPKLASSVITVWNILVRQSKMYVGHNVAYDMHMLANINKEYIHTNLRDSMHMIRLAHDNIPTRSGGVPLKLKEYTKRYLDPDAKAHDKLLQTERTAIAKRLNKQLQDAFNSVGHVPDGYRSWTVGAMKEYFKDPTFLVSDLPEDLQEVYLAWRSSLPKQIGDIVVGRVDKDDVPYNLLNRANVTKYGHMDIVYTLAVALQCMPVIELRENLKGLEIESELIPVFYEMERTGFQADKQYLIESKTKLRNYIHRRRKELVELTGVQFTISQSKVIMRIANEYYGLGVSSTGAEIFDAIQNTLDKDTDAYKFISLIQELRTLEKWYSTYLTRLEHDLIRSDKLYTQINSVGTASLRVTSNFQQFPKGGIKDIEGNELFNPRKIIVVSKGYDSIVYMDYSQIELRVQALYTLILGEGDMNLCRAYMPYKCYRIVRSNIPSMTHEEFDPFNKYHIRDWRGEWYHNEDDERWVPVDLHGATTKEAFGIDESHPDFKRLRSQGKRVNFAKNYGATFSRIKIMFPEYDDAQVKQIDEGYYKAFPGIRIYQDYCYRLANHQAFATNLFDVKYWNVSGHNLINMLIQGSSAVFLKLKEIEIHKYLKKHGYKSRMQMNIHDEISFLKHPDDPKHIWKDIQRIMEQWDDAPVPIVADLEITYTNWADKEDWEI